MRGASLAAALVLAAAPGGADSIDDYVRAEMERQRIPGLSLAVTRDGALVKAEGYGLANVEHSVPATADTVFQSGSVGKQFTSAAVMLLAEEGRLGLDDPLARWFEGAPASWRDVRVHHLLTHTSGIKDYDEKDIDYRKDYTEENLVRVAMALPPDFPPGTRWSYSNTAYVLLGVIVRKASGQFYGDFLRERVFQPLGMSATRVITEAEIVPHRAAGYRLEKGTLRNQEWVSPSLNTTADGSLYLTVRDLARWDAALWAGRLLQPASYTRMWTPVRLSGGGSHGYGFGWGLDEQRGHPTVGHGGSWQGFRSAIVRYPEQRLSVMVLSNLAQAEPERIARGVAGLVVPVLALPDPRTPRTDPDPARTAALREVLQAFAEGRSSPRMAAPLRAARTGTARDGAERKRTADRLATATAFTFLAEDDVSSRALERRGERIARILHYALVAGEEPLPYRFYLTARGEVADFVGP